MSVIEKLGITRWTAKEVSDEEYMVVDSGNDIVSVMGCDYSDYLYHDKQDAQLIATAPEMLERDIKFREYLFNKIDKYIRMGDTGNVYLLREIWKNFDFTVDEKATNKSWDEIRELINV